MKSITALFLLSLLILPITTLASGGIMTFTGSIVSDACTISNNESKNNFSFFITECPDIVDNASLKLSTDSESEYTFSFIPNSNNIHNNYNKTINLNKFKSKNKELNLTTELHLKNNPTKHNSKIKSINNFTIIYN